MGLEPRALQLTRSCCPDGPHAACSRSSRTGSELSATGFRPIWTHGGNGPDPMGCTERPRAACEGRALSGPPSWRLFLPSGCRTCWARCWTRWITCTTWISSTGERVARPLLGGGTSQSSVRRGEGGAAGRGWALLLQEHLPDSEGVPPPPRPSPGTPGVGGSKMQGKKQTAAPAASGHAQAELLTLGVAEAVQLHAVEPPSEGEKTM